MNADRITLENDPTYNAFLADGLIAESTMNDTQTAAPVETQPTTPAETQVETKREEIYIGKGEDGLKPNFTYPLKEDGRIDWEKLINPKYFIYPDNDPLKSPMVRVDGLRDLAAHRGVVAKEVEIMAVSERFVQCKVKMVFKPNRDDKDGLMWAGSADATPDNINGRMFGKFLTACAETRAVGRCIKEALGIRIMTAEEVTGENVDADGSTAINDEVVHAILHQLKVKGKTVDEQMAEIQEKYPTIKSLKDLTKEQGAKLLQSLNTKPNKTD